MRLIDTDRLMEDFRNTITEQSDTLDWLNMISSQPTAYDVDKVVERLEEMRSKREEQLRTCADNDMADYLRCKMSTIAEIIEIVKSGSTK